MTCNHCSTVSNEAAKAVGAPEVEATWAENRDHPRYCPTCRGFLRADGGCTKCEQASSTRTQVFLTYEKDLHGGDQVEAVFETESMAIDHIISEHFGNNSYYQSLTRQELEIEANYYIKTIPVTQPPRPPQSPEPEITPPKWRLPSWWRAKLDENVTDEQIEAWRQETEECVAHNKAEAARRETYRAQARKLLVAIYGHHSRQLKYFDREKPARPPMLDFKYNVERKVRELRDEATAKAEAKRKALEQQKMTQDAITWLNERGLKLGDEFNLETAIDTANSVAFDEEVERRMADGGPFEFAGDSECSEECDGWDGVSKRCECGNRRVVWTEGWGHSFKNPYIYAEAV